MPISSTCRQKGGSRHPCFQAKVLPLYLPNLQCGHAIVVVSTFVPLFRTAFKHGPCRAACGLVDNCAVKLLDEWFKADGAQWFACLSVFPETGYAHLRNLQQAVSKPALSILDLELGLHMSVIRAIDQMVVP